MWNLKNCTNKLICKGNIVRDVENQHDYQGGKVCVG